MAWRVSQARLGRVDHLPRPRVLRPTTEMPGTVVGQWRSGRDHRDQPGSRDLQLTFVPHALGCEPRQALAEVLLSCDRAPVAPVLAVPLELAVAGVVLSRAPEEVVRADARRRIAPVADLTQRRTGA